MSMAAIFVHRPNRVNGQFTGMFVDISFWEVHIHSQPLSPRPSLNALDTRD